MRKLFYDFCPRQIIFFQTAFGSYVQCGVHTQKHRPLIEIQPMKAP